MESYYVYKSTTDSGELLYRVSGQFAGDHYVAKFEADSSSVIDSAIEALSIAGEDLTVKSSVYFAHE